jgi:hypothetical protein
MPEAVAFHDHYLTALHFPALSHRRHRHAATTASVNPLLDNHLNVCALVQV